METTLVTLTNPLAVGFWFTVGCTLAGLAMGVIVLVLGGILKLLVG